MKKKKITKKITKKQALALIEIIIEAYMGEVPFKGFDIHIIIDDEKIKTIEKGEIF